MLANDLIVVIYGQMNHSFVTLVIYLLLLDYMLQASTKLLNTVYENKQRSNKIYLK